MRYGTWRGRRALKGLGYAIIGTGFTGRGLTRAFIAGIKGSVKLAGLSWRAAKKTGRFSRDTANFARYLIKGEERNVEEEFHQSIFAASVYGIGKSLLEMEGTKEEFLQLWEGAEKELSNINSNLASLQNVEDMDEYAKEYFLKICAAFYREEALLCNYDQFEAQIRKKYLDDGYSPH